MILLVASPVPTPSPLLHGSVLPSPFPAKFLVTVMPAEGNGENVAAIGGAGVAATGGGGGLSSSVSIDSITSWMLFGIVRGRSC